MGSLVWFGNNLRVNDNTSLIKACSSDSVIGVFCFDPRWFQEGDYGFVKMGKYRVKFLWETVKALQTALKALNIPLLVHYEKPEVILPKLITEHRITTVFFQKEWTRDEIKVCHAVIENAPDSTSFEADYDQFLFHPEDIPYSTTENIPDVFTAFRKKCEKYAQVRSALEVPEPKAMENLPETPLPLPTLQELGISKFETDARSAFPFHGGEDSANNRLHSYFWETHKLAYYKHTRNGLIGTDYSSKFSPWLANGALSPKTIYWEVRRFERDIRKNQDTYWLVFELIWRDYFKYISLKYKEKIFGLGGILQKEYTWKNEEKAKQDWIGGTTTEPFVNANMLELAHTGWMSNRGRQNVASYWSKTLEQDWRIGAAYFESMLIDYDVHSNWGNWMYNSGVGNDPRDRKFNINRQAEMYDPKGTFQKLWLQQSLF
ncbi:MAG: DASH family cryptochrome [Bacteroidota bacterium]